MPRVKKTDAHSGKLLFPNLLAELVEELKAGREFGQPRIEEEEFPRTHLKKVTVIWDKWEGVPDQERVETILRAYQQADGKLYQVFPNLRQGDNRVAARQAVQIPAHDDLFRWKIGPPFGKEIVKVIASPSTLRPVYPIWASRNVLRTLSVIELRRSRCAASTST